MTEVNQLASCISTQDQAAEIFSSPFRFGESRNHAFLGELRLDLQPLPASFAHQVVALRMFGDDALKAFLFNDLEKQDAVFPDVIAEF